MAQISSAPPAIPREKMKGVVAGIFFMATFSTFWATMGIFPLNGWGGNLPWIMIALIFIVLTGVGTYFRRIADKLPATTMTDAQKRTGANAGKQFLIIFTIEGIYIGATFLIGNLTNHFAWILPIMALIVGLHFLPLAKVLHRSSHYITGILLCLIALLTLLILPAESMVNGQKVVVWWVATGIGCACILWLSAITFVASALKMLRPQQSM